MDEDVRLALESLRGDIEELKQGQAVMRKQIAFVSELSLRTRFEGDALKIAITEVLARSAATSQTPDRSLSQALGGIDRETTRFAARLEPLSAFGSDVIATTCATLMSQARGRLGRLRRSGGLGRPPGGRGCARSTESAA